MHTAVKHNPPRQQGKSLATLRTIEFYIKSGSSLFLGTNNQQIWYNEIKSRWPDVKLKIVKNGVMINGK